MKPCVCVCGDQSSVCMCVWARFPRGAVLALDTTLHLPVHVPRCESGEIRGVTSHVRTHRLMPVSGVLYGRKVAPKLSSYMRCWVIHVSAFDVSHHHPHAAHCLVMHEMVQFPSRQLPLVMWTLQ